MHVRQPIGRAVAHLAVALVLPACAIRPPSQMAARVTMDPTMTSIPGHVSIRGLSALPADVGRLLVCLVDETTDVNEPSPSLGQSTDLAGMTQAARVMAEAQWTQLQQLVVGGNVLDAAAASDWARYAVLDLGVPDRSDFSVRFRHVPAGTRSWSVLGLLFDQQDNLVAFDRKAWADPLTGPSPALELRWNLPPGDGRFLIKGASPAWPQEALYLGLVDLAPRPHPGGTLEEGGTSVALSDPNDPLVRAVTAGLLRSGASPLRVQDLQRWRVKMFPGAGRNRLRLSWLKGAPSGEQRVFAAWKRKGGIYKVAVGTPDPATGELLLDGDEALLASDDPGDRSATHEHVFVSGGLSHPFVWIPRFEAWQLIQPAQCGPDHADKPVGAWVSAQPDAGIPEVDWAKETFGGFYVARYEASRQDGTPGDPSTGAGATAGTATALKIARWCVPWTGLSWEDAEATCRSFHPDAHLMREDEWTALTVWRMTRTAAALRGNNATLRDADDPDTVFLQDPTGPTGRALTGSGRSSNGAWPAGTDKTSHDDTVTGVMDLLGNVAEVSEGIRLASGRALTDGRDAGPFVVGYILSLATHPDLRKFGVPLTATFQNNDPAFSSAFYYGNGQRTIRGGAFGEAKRTLWDAALKDAVPDDGSIGFRPVVSF